MADNTELFDEYGRVVRPVLFNTAKDGSGTWYFPLVDASGQALVADSFGGATYVNQDTATGDAARRFETSEKKLRDVVLRCATNDQLLGDSSGQTYPLNVGETLSFEKLDASTLYFKNAVGGSNGTVDILGVEE